MGNWKFLKAIEIIELTGGKKRAILLLLMVFLLDLFMPLTGAVSALYLCCFFYLCRESKKTIMVFASVILLFTIIPIITAYPPSNNYIMLFNKAITIFAIIITTICAVRYKKLYDRIDNYRNTYVKELGEMQFMVSHRMRKPITSYLELMNIVESEKVLTQAELKLIMKHIKLSAFELDSFTNELTKLMCDSVKKCRMEELKTKA